MRVLVCGGRDYSDRAHVYATLERLNRERPIRGIIHGCAKGADQLASDWQHERIKAAGNRHELWIAGIPALWEEYGPAAGPIRNKHMLVEWRPQLVVAFPGGKGTADMVRQAKAAGVEVIEIAPVPPQDSGSYD